MLRILLVPLLAMGLTACNDDETVAAYDGDKVWQLSDLDGTAFTARATLEFGADGAVSGNAACNSFRTTQTKPYPWVGFGPIASTKMACPDMAAEILYLSALPEMSQAEVVGDVMILSNDAGREMVFKAIAPAG